MASQEHLSGELLLGFLREETAGSDRQMVVRHLLRGCEQCRRLAWRVWFSDEEVNPRRDKQDEPKFLLHIGGSCGSGEP